MDDMVNTNATLETMNAISLVNKQYFDYAIESLRKTEFVRPHLEEDAKGGELGKAKPLANPIYYLNDTQVEHVRIQDMNGFLSGNYGNCFPQEFGFYLNPGEQSCSPTNALALGHNNLNTMVLNPVASNRVNGNSTLTNPMSSSHITSGHMASSYPVPSSMISNLNYTTSNQINPNIMSSNPMALNHINLNTSKPNFSNTNISNLNFSKPNVSNSNVSNPNVVNPNVSNPNVSNPYVSNPNVSNPNFSNPNASSFSSFNANLSNLHPLNSTAFNPTMFNPASIYFPQGYQSQSHEKLDCHGIYFNPSDIRLQCQFNDQVKEGLQYLNILHSKTENDVPEFVDIHKLSLPLDCNGCLNLSMARNRTDEEPLFLKKPSAGDITTQNLRDAGEPDDDVVFVKEYKVDNEPEEVLNESEDKAIGSERSHQGMKVCRRRRPKKTFEPRRNPKRQVQLQKASYDLAIKLSLSECPKKTLEKELCLPIRFRRSCRSTGAVFSPPRPLNDCDYKEWPTDGMHERPKYNSDTDKLEKLDYDYVPPKKVLAKPKKQLPVRRKSIIRRRRNSRKIEVEVNPKFAQLTHETLLMMVDYIKELKECNELILKHQDERGNIDDESDNMARVPMDKALTNNEEGNQELPAKEIILEDGMTEGIMGEETITKEQMTNDTMTKEVVTKRAIPKEPMTREEVDANISKAQCILSDTSVLYCLANNVPQSDLAVFLQSLVKVEGVEV